MTLGRPVWPRSSVPLSLQTSFGLDETGTGQGGQHWDLSGRTMATHGNVGAWVLENIEREQVVHVLRETG
ncbi:MAG TPA: hypothetical protein VHP35_15620, partial [Terriglobia bacterium]|nr:hypothetical protein [Terriglobia bacterium]